MLKQRKNPISQKNEYFEESSDVGNLDYLLNGTMIKNAPTKSVMVTSQSDLSSLTGYEAGTIAFTAGFANMWQLSAAGTWVEV